MKRLVLLGLGVILMTGVSSPAHAEREFDFGDHTSETLASKAWEALDAGDHEAVDVYTSKLISLYEGKALEMSSTLRDFAPEADAFEYWALNDVATAYFIRGMSLKSQGREQEASDAFNTITQKFPYAQAWDTRGWFWKQAQGAKDQLNTLGTDYDFGDYTSQTLTTRAWQALEAKDYYGVDLYARKCIELYQEEAEKQQSILTDYATKEKAFNYWALNDVATAYFILGEGLMAQERYAEAKEVFKKVVDRYGYAQCWDPKGWFWKVAVASRGRLNKIQYEVGI